MYTQLCGWHDRPADVAKVAAAQPFPNFVTGAQAYGSAGVGKGKRTLLYNALYKAVGGKANWHARLQTIGDCFLAGTPVRMADGSEKAIEDIQIGDMVVSHLNRPQRVTNTIKKQYSGDMVTIRPEGYGFPLTATEDHKVVHYPDIPYGRNSTKVKNRRKATERAVWHAIGKLDRGHRVLLPQLTAFETIVPEMLDIKALAGCDLRRYRCVCRGKETTKPFPNAVLTDTLTVDERFARFVGLWLAEGSCETSRIAFSLSRQESLLAAEILQLGLDLFGVRGRIEHMPSKPNVVMVKFNSTPLARFFAGLIPGNVWTKRVPDCFMRARRGVKLALLRGWLDGDGSGHGYNQNVGTSVCRELRYTLAQVAMAAGLKPCCPTRRARGRSKEAGNVTFYGDDLYQLYPERSDLRVRTGRKAARTALGLAVPVKKIERKAVTDVTVYCLDVANDHSFVASGYAVHNCVSMGAAGAVDVLRALEFVMNQSEYIAETATEPTYALSRIDIGKGALGNEDGSVGAWAAEACKRFGTLVRRKYGDIDLSIYDGQRAKQWGSAGCPDSLKPAAHEHLVQTTSLVTTWAEFCDAIAAGYPVTIASNQGFTNVRDSQGFLKPSGSWPHQMYGSAADDQSGRPGGLIQNSWGDDWVTGPTQFDQPPGSFWVDAEVIERMLAAQDAWAYSNLQGYPVKKFDLGDIF